MAMTESRSDAVSLCTLGALSGAVAWGLISLAGAISNQLVWSFFDGAIELSPVSLLPGLVFGLIIGALLRRHGKISPSAHVWYAIASGVAYFCAFHVAARTFLNLPHAFGTLPDTVLSGILAGLVGSLLLGLIAMRLLQVPGRLLLGRPLFVGSTAGALLGLTERDNTQWGWTFLAFFVLWQAAYAMSLARLLRALPDSRR
jgi:hypothetical protein